MTRQHTGFLMVQLDILWFGATPHADLDSRQGNKSVVCPSETIGPANEEGMGKTHSTTIR